MARPRSSLLDPLSPLDPQHGIFVAIAIAERDRHGRMAWRVVWDGNHDSKAGQLRHRRALRCDAYARMVEVLRHGRRGVQADLFCRLG